MIILNIIALCWWEMMMKSKNGLHIQPQVGTGKEVIVLQALNHFRLPDFLDLQASKYLAARISKWMKWYLIKLNTCLLWSPVWIML